MNIVASSALPDEGELRRQLAQQRKVLRNLLTAVDRHVRLQLPESLALLDKRSEEAALKAARECWSGQGWNASRAEAGDATALALRGRAPFDDALDDATRDAAEARFAATAVAVFDALEGHGAVDPEALR